MRQSTSPGHKSSTLTRLDRSTKTTTTINLATSLAAIKKNVLIIDADPQGNASTGLGLAYDKRNPSIYEMIHEKKFLMEGIKETLIPGLKIIGANTNLAAAEVELVNFDRREFVFKSIFEEINNGIEAIDVLDYVVPFGFIGQIFHPYLVQPKLEEIFDYRKNKLEEIFGQYHD